MRRDACLTCIASTRRHTREDSDGPRRSGIPWAGRVHDVLKPLPLEDRFASAALDLVLHCLPGPMQRKAAAIANVAAVLDGDGVLFGASVLGRSAEHGRLARAVLRAFNAEGGFDNLDDSEEGIREILAASFRDVEVRGIGSVAYFRAANPSGAAG